MSTDLCYRAPDGQGWLSYTTGEYIRGGLDDWPSVENTGWEATGLEELATYVGTHRIVTPTEIDGMYVTFGDRAMFVAEGGHLRVTRSFIDAFLDVNGDDSGSSLFIADSKVVCPPQSNPAIGYSHLDIRRCDIRGGQHSVLGSNTTRIEDSILHMQFNDPDAVDGYHNNAWITNGGSDILLLHNTLDCSTELTPNNGGPTGDASMFGDFGPVHDIVIDGCLFKETTGSFGLSAGWNPGKPYGDNPYNIIIRNNVFERGSTGHNGASGPVTSFKADGPGNVWENNRYDDGTLIGPGGQELDG